ncbi:MAG: copper amine oxidase N-terminal domain-containing protein [Oscillospiraceae bacterium]|nr:copper amine oxidase N-terminal domain-containing protein [Oscillospiraceae bacterium]
MKGKLSGFVFRVLFTVMMMGLIGTVSAARTNRTAELYYNDIKVTLDGQEVRLVDAGGNPVEPFIIDGTTYLPVRAVAGALGLEVGWNGETSTVILTSKNYRPQREGFDQSKNQKIALGNYTFSIPDYWTESDSEEKDTFRYYAETNGKVAMLYIYCAEDNERVSYDELVADRDNMIVALEGSLADVKAKVTGDEMFQGGDDAKGVLYSYSMEVESDGLKLPGTGKIFCYPSVEDNKWFFLWFATTDNTEYTYDDDFTKILLTIKKDTGSQGIWVGGTPTNPSTETNPGTSSGTSTSGNSQGKDPGDMPDGSQWVYVTPTGSRYHYDSTCNGGKYTLVTLEEALRRHLTPCQKCVLH